MTQKFIEIAIDLETFSSQSDALMVSLGAATRDFDGSLITFENVVAPNHYSDELHVSHETINWWLKQSEAARASITNGTKSLVEVCSNFNYWLKTITPTDHKPRLWGNGATFDNVILRYNYRVAKMTPGWGFREDMCYRTLKNLFPDIPFVPPTVAHSAVSDAVAQFLHLEKLLERVNNG